MLHCQVFFPQRPARVYVLCIAGETRADASAILTQIPHRLGHLAFGTGGQAVIEIVGIGKTLALDRQIFEIVPG
jgi:hypothetical protein